MSMPWSRPRECALETASREHLCRQLLERSLDLALLSEPTKIDEIALHPIGELVFELVSREPAANADSLMQMPHIHLDWGTSFEPPSSRLQSLQKTPVLHSRAPPAWPAVRAGQRRGHLLQGAW